MFNKIVDYYFWFTQPATIFTSEDYVLAYIFLGLLILAVIFWTSVKFSKNTVNRKVFKKFWHLFLGTGLVGLVWLLLRYENTYIFSKRFWAGLDIALGIIWLLFILKYLIFDYRRESREYERQIVKDKYIPGKVK